MTNARIPYNDQSSSERDVMPILEHAGPPLVARTQLTLPVLARRLGLSFWRHEAEENDFIVVHFAPLEQGVSR